MGWSKRRKKTNPNADQVQLRSYSGHRTNQLAHSGKNILIDLIKKEDRKKKPLHMPRKEFQLEAKKKYQSFKCQLNFE